MAKPKAFLSWSSGKDSAFALHETLKAGEVEIVGLLTTLNMHHGRVAMHGVREALLDAQAAALGLPMVKVELPWPCPNGTYERLMADAVEAITAQGVTHMIFGDLFLEDIRAYRETQLAGTGLTPVFPLWQRPTETLCREMIESGIDARLVCVDEAQLSPSFAGRLYDEALLADLPAGIDPCGERGEFHTCVVGSPDFSAPLSVYPGEVVSRDGFTFADLVPDTVSA